VKKKLNIERHKVLSKKYQYLLMYVLKCILEGIEFYVQGFGYRNFSTNEPGKCFRPVLLAFTDVDLLTIPGARYWLCDFDL
jgi:hypothetical protein